MTVTVCVRPCARGVGRRSESESAWERGHGHGRAIRDEWTLWRAVEVVVCGVWCVVVDMWCVVEVGESSCPGILQSLMTQWLCWQLAPAIT